jgi:hypothetical protein
MSNKAGCFKLTMLGCLGLFVILVIVLGGTALVAWKNIGDRRIEDKVLTPAEATATGIVTGSRETAVPAGTGRVVLELAQGEFQLHPALPGESIRVEAEFDSEVYRVEDHYEAFPDSSWVYGVRSYRTISGLQSLFREIMGGGHATKIDIYLPPDIPIELLMKVEEGGFEAEWGGLWLTAADVRYSKGGFSLDIDEPLKEPMSRLVIQGSMGGFEATGLGNASPAVLDINCRMGGGDVDLGGQWIRDCDVRLHVALGGMAVLVPRNVLIEGTDGEGKSLRRADAEMPLPTLRFTVSQKMGGIEIER